MKICIVDGRGGGNGIGSRIVEGLRSLAVDGHAVVGLGLNVVSAAAMARAGATQIETREQAITQQLGSADMIIGPLNLLMSGGHARRGNPARRASRAAFARAEIPSPD